MRTSPCAALMALPFLLAAALDARAAAQDPNRVRIGGGAFFESYWFGASDDIGLESVYLITVPVGGRVGITRGLDLEVAGTFARASLTDANGDATTLSGLTDTEIRLRLGLGRDLVTITGIALLPTGNNRLSSDEADLAGLIAADVLPFRISNWGTGGGVGLSSAVAWPMGDFAAGLSAGYVVAGEFEPSAGEDFAYRPGNQLHVTAALDRTMGESAKAALRVSFQRYAEDEVDGVNLYQAGNRLEVTGSYAFATGDRASAILYAGYLTREEGEFRDVRRGTPAQDLFFTGGGVRLPLSAGILVPTADLRLLRSDDRVGQGFTASLGGSLEWPMGTVTAVPTLRGRFGRVEVAEDVDSGITGVELGFSLRFGGGGN